MIIDIPAITQKESYEILEYVKNTKDGYMNRAGYHNYIYENYFQNKEWIWEEWLYWEKIFMNKLGKVPPRYYVYRGSEFKLEYIFHNMKVVEIKNLLEELNICIPNKMKKDALINLICEKEGVYEHAVIKALILKKLDDNKKCSDKAMYSMFMHTLHGRSMSLFERQQWKKIGIVEWELRSVFDDEKDFENLVLSMNKLALTPFYPSHMGIAQAIFPFRSNTQSKPANKFLRYLKRFIK